jgi:hypothetical protein
MQRLFSSTSPNAFTYLAPNEPDSDSASNPNAPVRRATDASLPAAAAAGLPYVSCGGSVRGPISDR